MASPFVIVIFGATGDLARHKLIPALFSLYEKGRLGSKFYIIGFSRRKLTDDDYRKMIRENWLADEKIDKTKKEEFLQNIYFTNGMFDELESYTGLNKRLNTFDKEIGACITRLFYLATPPDKYMQILNNLKESKLSEGCGQGSEKWTRLAIEKPFGKDLENARELDKKLAEMFEEKQIYRVDHYLAKETVQNMLAFRFANGIFEPVWSSYYIDHVQVTFAEKKGVENRGSFFDDIGILRDVAQNHLVQILATIAMGQPDSFSKEAIRDARAEAIKAIRFDAASDVIRGQYKGYHDEQNIKPGSKTETFAAMKLYVDTKRLKGVPFYIRAGKKMPKNMVEIKMVFIQTCHLLFKEYGCPEIENVLTIRIQPNEGISMRVVVKHPGNDRDLLKNNPKLKLDTVEMKFSYKEEFGEHGDEAYETLLMDIFAGDQMLFNRSDELEYSWILVSQIMDKWKEEDSGAESKIYEYEEGTWGPAEADSLLAADGRKWIE